MQANREVILQLVLQLILERSFDLINLIAHAREMHNLNACQQLLAKELVRDDDVCFTIVRSSGSTRLKIGLFL